MIGYSCWWDHSWLVQCLTCLFPFLHHSLVHTGLEITDWLCFPSTATDSRTASQPYTDWFGVGSSGYGWPPHLWPTRCDGPRLSPTLVRNLAISGCHTIPRLTAGVDLWFGAPRDSCYFLSVNLARQVAWIQTTQLATTPVQRITINWVCNS